MKKRLFSAFLSILIFVGALQIDSAMIISQIEEGIHTGIANTVNAFAADSSSCEHDYQYLKSTGSPTCTKSGYITYQCSICGYKKVSYTSLGHKYIATTPAYRAMTYKCEYCGDIVTKTVEYSMSMFNDNINKTPSRKNDNCFIDVVNDGVINAKDYAYLRNNMKHTLSNKNADQRTQQIYEYLCRINGKSVLSAQQESTWMGSVDYEIDYIKNATGKYPAMRGLDYMNDDFNGVNQRAIDWWNKGGLVTICWHTGSDFCGEWNDAQSDTVENWNDMLTPGTKQYEAMIAGMDKGAKALKQLQDAGVTVLWRPFHEFDGGWFWWGKNGADSFKKLWQIMYDRYTNYWGLNNLIWVLGYSHNGIDVANWYPGDDYYDIIGADSYDPEEFTSLYSKMTNLAANGKPVAMHECGENPTVDYLNTNSWCYFMTWHTQYLTDTNTKSALRTLYNSSKVITLDELDI